MAKATRGAKATKRKAAGKKAAVKRTAKAAKAAKKAAKKAARKRAPIRPIRRAAKKAAARRTPKKGGKIGKAAVAFVPRKRRAAKKARPAKAAKAAAPKKKAAAKPAPKPAPKAAKPKRAARPAPIRGAIPSSLSVAGGSSAARSGHNELVERLQENTDIGPAITAGDLDANWQVAYSSGDEAPGGDNPTPDQDVVDDIGHALGIEYEDSEELKGAAKLEERDRHRWELDPASSEDYPERED